METAKNLRQATVVETHEGKFNFDFLEKYLLEFFKIYDELKGTLCLFKKENLKNNLDRSNRDKCQTKSPEINSSRLKIEVMLKTFSGNVRINFTIFSTRRVTLEAKFKQLLHRTFFFFFYVQFILSEGVVPIGIVTRHPIAGVRHSSGSQIGLFVPKLGLNIYEYILSQYIGLRLIPGR